MTRRPGRVMAAPRTPHRNGDHPPMTELLDLPTGLLVEDDEVGGMLATAVMDEGREYRYLLTRIWDTSLAPMTVIMLNPSTADATVNDPTITRLIHPESGFARREQCGGIVVVNLFALRSTDPRVLRDHHDPVGQYNDAFVTHAVREAKLVVAAWGAHGVLHDRGQAVTALLRSAGVDVRCYGTTATGQPKHPLYLPKTATLTPYTPEQVAA